MPQILTNISYIFVISCQKLCIITPIYIVVIGLKRLRSNFVASYALPTRWKVKHLMKKLSAVSHIVHHNLFLNAFLASYVIIRTHDYKRFSQGWLNATFCFVAIGPYISDIPSVRDLENSKNLSYEIVGKL